MHRVLLVVVALLSSGCVSVVSPGEAEQLRAAERRWEAANIRNYSYQMRTSCFCGTEVIDWAVVEVRNGEVISAKSIDGTPLSGVALTSRLTVEELFERARARHDWLGNIDFEFDETLGYPLSVRHVAKRNIADADATYEARNLVPVIIAAGG